MVKQLPYLGALNGLYVGLERYTRSTPHQIVIKVYQLLVHIVRQGCDL